MITDISKEGMLKITAETPMEAFTLASWYEKWQKREVNFMVEAYPVDPSEDSEPIFIHPLYSPDNTDGGNE